MYAKIISLGLVTALLVINSGRARSLGVPADAAQGPQLVPQEVGDWRQTARWVYPSTMGQFQEYAQYARAGLLVTLAFDHNRLSAHNALDCFVGKGGKLESSSVRSLRTADGSARFNLARFDEGAAISMVAASQCLAQGCIENPPAASWADLGRLSFWKESLVHPRYSGIPVNISIASNAGQQQVSYTVMEQALTDFVEKLDLSAARRQASIERPPGQ